MEFRVLKYFLAVAKVENISKAAEEINISQPALSRQLMDLEEELGVKLLVRSKKRTVLTEEGYLLKKRAEEILTLVDKTLDELSHANDNISGSIRIGCGETAGMKVIAKAAQKIRRNYPRIYCHLYSMDDAGVKDRLLKGTLDFGVLVQPEPPKDYEYIEIDHKDIWGVFMPKTSPLAKLEKVTAKDLYDLPLIVSQQALANHELKSWFKKDESELNIVASYTLIYNASLLAEAGVGYLLSLDFLLNLTENSPLTFRPLHPPSVCRNFFVWKKNQVFSRAALLMRDFMANLRKD